MKARRTSGKGVQKLESLSTEYASDARNRIRERWGHYHRHRLHHLRTAEHAVMFEFIMRLFRAEPGAKIRKERDRKYKQAVQLQRDGKLREYAKIMKEIEELEKQYVEVLIESE